MKERNESIRKGNYGVQKSFSMNCERRTRPARLVTAYMRVSFVSPDSRVELVRGVPEKQRKKSVANSNKCALQTENVVSRN